MHSKYALTLFSILFFTATLSCMKLESPIEIAPNPFDIDVHLLAEQGKTRSVEESIIQALVDIDTQRESDGQTIAHIAATTNNNELIQFLLNHDANFRIQDHNGNTAFHCALIAGSLTTAGLIFHTHVSNSAVDILDLSLRNSANQTVLDCAINYQIQKYRFLRAQLGKDGSCLCATIKLDGETKATLFKQGDTNHPLYRIDVGQGTEWCVSHGGHCYCLIFPHEISPKSWYQLTEKRRTKKQRIPWAYVNPFELVDIIGKLKWLTPDEETRVIGPTGAMETPLTPTPLVDDPAAAEIAHSELRRSLTDRLAALYTEELLRRASLGTTDEGFEDIP